MDVEFSTTILKLTLVLFVFKFLNSKVYLSSFWLSIKLAFPFWISYLISFRLPPLNILFNENLLLLILFGASKVYS